MRSDKFCFSKWLGIVVLIGLFLLGFVVVSQNVSNTKTSTNTRASEIKEPPNKIGRHWFNPWSDSNFNTLDLSVHTDYVTGTVDYNIHEAWASSPSVSYWKDTFDNFTKENNGHEVNVHPYISYSPFKLLGQIKAGYTLVTITVDCKNGISTSINEKTNVLRYGRIMQEKCSYWNEGIYTMTVTASLKKTEASSPFDVKGQSFSFKIHNRYK